MVREAAADLCTVVKNGQTVVIKPNLVQMIVDSTGEKLAGYIPILQVHPSIPDSLSSISWCSFKSASLIPPTVPTGTMMVHPVRMTGMVIGASQTYEYFEMIQDRIISFVILQLGQLRQHVVILGGL